MFLSGIKGYRYSTLEPQYNLQKLPFQVYSAVQLMEQIDYILNVLNKYETQWDSNPKMPTYISVLRIPVLNNQ